MEKYHVDVIGGGNAALSAAIAARRIVQRVLVLERAPEQLRGGNTRHTRNIRCAHASADQFFSAPYSEEEFLEDLIAVTGAPANLDLARLAVRQSSGLPQWMSEHGISWQQPVADTLHLGRTNRWFLGGGKTLLNSYYRTAHRMGIEVRYGASVEDLVIENGRFEAVVVKTGGTHDARAPKFDGGIVTRIDAISFGIVVNRLGCRFYDEGEEIWPNPWRPQIATGLRDNS